MRVKSCAHLFPSSAALGGQGSHGEVFTQAEVEPVFMSRVASVHTLCHQACLCTDLDGAAKLLER